MQMPNALQVCCAAVLCALISIGDVRAESGSLTIRGEPPNPTLSAFLGNAWTLYIEGEIGTDAGERLETYLLQNKVPENSHVYLHSPGGNLIGGMALGRAIRAHRLFTNVGRFPLRGDKAKGSPLPGECYSACAIAFLGGQFRFVQADSKYGVHRFRFTNELADKEGLAQAMSALVSEYIRNMDVDLKLFTLASSAGPSEMLVLAPSELDALNVINNGRGKTTWSIESTANPAGMYLKGEQETIHGVNKFMIVCPAREPPFLYIIFDAQGREREILQMGVEQLWLDGAPVRIDHVRVKKQVQNGWINAVYPLTAQIRASLSRAREKVGLSMQWRSDAGLFFGFDSMPFRDGATKLPGFLRVCERAG